MNPQGINIFNKADRDHVVVSVPDHLKLQLFPAENGFLYQHLSYKAGLKPSGAYGFQLFPVINQSAPCAAHGVSGTENYRIAQLVRNGEGFFHGIGDLASGHFDSQSVHGILKLNPVFSAFNGVYLHADDLYVIFVQDSFLGQFGTEIQTGLASQVGEKGIRALFCDNLFQTVHIQWFYIGDVGSFRIGHNCGRI